MGEVRIRMYRHGLGDCFLVRFPKNSGGTFNVLIDCGLIAVASDPKPTMQGVVADIAEECGNRIDVAVMTHEHWDHASGYSAQQAQDAFDKIDIGEAWYAWTEDPKSVLGSKLRSERAAKVQALQRAALALRSSGTQFAVDGAERIESILQFFGVASAQDLRSLGATKNTTGKTRQAFDYLANRRGVKTVYCYPDAAPMDLAEVEGVRVYVLGPPQDEGLIKRSAPTKKGAEVYEFGADLALDSNLAAAFERLLNPGTDSDGADCPFEVSLGIRPADGSMSQHLQEMIDRVWDAPEMGWRRIEEDWTAAAEMLALNLDNHTNNTCLVLAFELVESGQVLLFAADAQVGNWLSWQNTRWDLKSTDGSINRITGPDLLRRAIFYKVGHHGSHNATLRALGLEQMLSEDLTAFVPVFKEQAVKNRWMGMPFAPLVKRLNEKTRGRLVFSDPNIAAPAAATLSELIERDRDSFLTRLRVDKKFYEYSVTY